MRERERVSVCVCVCVRAQGWITVFLSAEQHHRSVCKYIYTFKLVL